MMTEHDQGFTPSRYHEYRDACARASSSEMLVVPGIEYSDAANRVHVLVWGEVSFLGNALPTIEVLERTAAADGVAVLAHPTRKDAWKCFEPWWADKLAGIEMWNRKYDGWAQSTTASALLEATATLPFVGLDFHTRRQSFPLGMVLDVEMDVSEQRVLECLRLGRCHPRVFGLPLSHKLVRASGPALSIVEASRRRVALIARAAKTLHGDKH